MAIDASGDHEVWATIPINAAAIACDVGRYDDADRYIALAVASSGQLDDLQRSFALLRAASDVSLARGRYLEAKQKIETAIAILDGTRALENADLARALATLADLERELGDPNSAIAAAGAALRAWPYGRGPQPYWLASSWCYAQWALGGDWPLFREKLKALAAVAAQEGPANQIDFWSNLALVCSDRRRFPAADSLYRLVIKSLDANGDSSLVQRIDARRQHAIVLGERQRFDHALRCLAEASSLVEEGGDGARFYRHVLARDRARLHERQGDRQSAMQYYLIAIVEEAKNIGGWVGATLSLKEMFSQRDAIDAISPLLRLTAEDPTPENCANAHLAVLISRGRASKSRALQRRMVPEGLRTMLHERAETARIVAWGSRLREAGFAPRDLASHALRLFRLDASLTVEATNFVDLDNSIAEQRLPALAFDEATIDFVVTVEIEFGQRDVRLFAFITQATATDRALLSWPKASSILVGFDDLCRCMARSISFEIEAEVSLQLDTLSKDFWLPIEKHLDARVRRLLLRPDGNLGQAPFAALRGSDGRSLCEKFEIVFQSAHEAPKNTRVLADGFLIFGNPAPARCWRDRVSLALGAVMGIKPIVLPTAPLRYAEREAQAIAQMLGADGTRKGRVLLGAEARRGAVVEGPHARIMHFATHGFAVSRQDIAGSPREAAVVSHADIDWRTGLVCAGAKAWLTRNGQLGGDDDGLLLARDIALLDRRGRVGGFGGMR